MKMESEMRKSALNRELTVGADGWIHVVPVGEFPGRLAGVQGKAAEILQVIDDEALNRIMAAFAEQAARPGFTGLLLDKEHFSHAASQSSEACAWIMKLENRADGIWGLPEWTDMGKTLIEGKRYKRLSPSFALDRIADRRYRPVVLTDAALTNAANLPLTPIQNREGGEEEETGMNELAKLLRERLGLDAAADEAALIAAVKTAMDEAAAQKTKLAALEQSAVNREADAWCEKHKGKLIDVAAARKLFVENREAAEALIALVKPSEPEKRVLNRQDGQPPVRPVVETGDVADKRATALNRAARNYRAQHPNATFEQAWEAAKEEVEQAE